MKYDKIMAGGNPDNIMSRLKGCLALLYLLYEIAGVSAISGFQADIDAAEDYTGKGTTV